MTKIQSQYEDLQKAFGRLKEAVILPSDVTINQDATIQRFEFTFELAWKLMKTILEEEGIKVVSPKNVIREGATIGLIDDPQKWFVFLENKNLSVHTYKEEIAQKVYKSAKEFISFADKLILKAKNYLV